jgi:hypothetical protein
MPICTVAVAVKQGENIAGEVLGVIQNLIPYIFYNYMNKL